MARARDNGGSAALPECATELIRQVSRKMRYRRKARDEVQAELTAHFVQIDWESRVKGCYAQFGFQSGEVSRRIAAQVDGQRAFPVPEGIDEFAVVGQHVFDEMLRRDEGNAVVGIEEVIGFDWHIHPFAVFAHAKDGGLSDEIEQLVRVVRIGDEIIGALDVQSVDQAAFDQEDVNALTSLADQIAIAIQNARLFQQSQAALEEAERAQRLYVRRQWNQLTSERPALAYEYTLTGTPAPSFA